MAAKRTPVPAGGQPTPATIAAADATPVTTPAGNDTPPAPAPADPVGPAPEVTPADTTDTSPADVADARVLVAFDEHRPDDVVTAPAAEIELMKLAGKVDPHPDAVAYARSLVA